MNAHRLPWGRSALDAVLVALAMVAVLLVPGRSQAHPPEFFYSMPDTWAAGTDVSFRLQVGFPTGMYRNAVADAIAQWNARGGPSAPDFLWNQPDGFGSFEEPCSNDANVVVWTNLDYLGPGVRGMVKRCIPGPYPYGHVIRVSIGVDSTHFLPNTSQPAWYTGESEAVPSDEHTDLRSVLTHEFGHATGWSGHYSEHTQGVCPRTTERPVMCDPIYRGTSWQRDLEDHDIHTFEAAYPGDGGPGPSPTTPPPAPTGLKADLNGDRIPDLLTQVANGDVYVYPGSGSVNSTITFWAGTRIGNWSGHTNLTLGDLNNDGKADLLSQVASTGDVYVYRGSGSVNTSTTFWSPIYIGNWANHTNLVLGDLNNDGKADLLTQIAGQGDLYVYRGSGSVNSSTTFWSGIRVGNWANHTNLALGDLNNDGLTDLLSQVVGSGDVYVYRGSGSVNTSTTFWSPVYIGNWANHTNLVLGDLNRDRLPDLLTQVTGTGDLYVYRGSGSINASTTFWSSIHIGNWAGHTNLTN